MGVNQNIKVRSIMAMSQKHESFDGSFSTQ